MRKLTYLITGLVLLGFQIAHLIQGNNTDSTVCMVGAMMCFAESISTDKDE